MTHGSGAVHGSGEQPRLRIIYRSHGGEGLKARPDYYSKLLALSTVVRAVKVVEDAGADPQLIFWNDGPMPGDRLELMSSVGEVIQINAGSNRRSYRAALEVAAHSDWGPQDLIWFAEDDYIYRPESFQMLLAALKVLPDVDYISMFGGLALDLTSPRRSPRWMPQLGAADVPHPIEIDGTHWYRGVSTTSTFGVRHSVLRQDLRLLRTLPFSGGSWDHTTCLTVQGRQPFSWSEIGEEVLPFSALPAAQWPASIARGVVRTGVNFASRRSPDLCRTLYLCDPIGAFHMERDAEGSGLDWAAMAEDARAWALSQGIPVDTAPVPSN